MSWKPLAAVGTAVTGTFTVLGALLDPTFLMTNPDIIFSLGFTIIKGGQEVAPDLPWDRIIVVLVTASVLLTLSKIYDKRTSQQ